MRRLSIAERPNWQTIAEDHGFNFYHSGGEKYWDESHIYAFSMEQVEGDIEQTSTELHSMCLDLVSEVVKSEALMSRLAIPAEHHDLIANSWRACEPSLYGRFDLSYAGEGPAILLEYNADTPTSIYETGFFQWHWLEDMVSSGRLPKAVDQFNGLHEALIHRFGELAKAGEIFHFTSVPDHLEDRQTIHYLEDLSRQAGCKPHFTSIADIGVSNEGRFVDESNIVIERIFKLYPWEDMLREGFGIYVAASGAKFFEPPWKAILSNKGILPLLWKSHPGHPNLVPAAFWDDDLGKAMVGDKFVKKPLFSREGWDIEFVDGKTNEPVNRGGYGDEGFIVQQLVEPPKFDDAYPVIGTWIVGNEAVAMSVREDNTPVTRDLARFVPHIILPEGEAIT